MFRTIDWRLPSLVTGASGANTFPMRKQLPNPHFQNTKTIVFLVFPTFSSNKCWWRLHAFSFDRRRFLSPLERPFRAPARGQVTTVGDSTGDYFKRVRPPNLVQYHDFPYCRFPFISLMFLCITLWCFSVFFKCMHGIDIYSFDAHKHQHFLLTLWVKKGPYTRVRGNIGSGGESVIMLSLRLDW